MRCEKRPDFCLIEANTPFLVHVGGDGVTLVDPVYHKNGIKKNRAAPGGEGVGAKDYMGIAHTAQVFLASMIFDGVLERFSTLKGGAVEIGSLWVPGWLRALDIVQKNFTRSEPALTDLKMSATEYVKRQLRFHTICA